MKYLVYIGNLDNRHVIDTLSYLATLNPWIMFNYPLILILLM